MPKNLTWWEARNYTLAGVPVRREPWLDPLIWITHTTGIYWRHEEENAGLPAPAEADRVLHVVRAAEFRAPEFLAADWTTLAPGAVDPPPDPNDPTGGGGPDPRDPGGRPPSGPDDGGGGDGKYPPVFPPDGGGGGGDDGGDGGGVIVVLPPSEPTGGPKPPRPPHDPAPPTPIPTPGGFADAGTYSITASLSGMGPGQAWSVVAFYQGVLHDMGVLSADGSLTISAPDLIDGEWVTLRFTALDGPHSLHGYSISIMVQAED